MPPSLTPAAAAVRSSCEGGGAVGALAGEARRSVEWAGGGGGPPWPRPRPNRAERAAGRRRRRPGRGGELVSWLVSWARTSAHT